MIGNKDTMLELLDAHKFIVCIPLHNVERVLGRPVKFKTLVGDRHMVLIRDTGKAPVQVTPHFSRTRFSLRLKTLIKRHYPSIRAFCDAVPGVSPASVKGWVYAGAIPSHQCHRDALCRLLNTPYDVLFENIPPART